MKEKMSRHLDESLEELHALSKAIWDNPEVAFNEHFAKKAQMEFMSKNGFNVMDIEGIDTAFIAEYGSGSVKVGFLGEYDALPGLSQEVSAERKPVVENGNGHGCGHNLIGVGSIAAAIALKEAAEAEKLDCTIRYYGCPAEEAIVGKLDMIEKDVFRDLDFCLTWHPFDVNKVWTPTTLSSIELLFKFKGIASHAADGPHLGRSALDAVELMNVGVNYLREHVIDKARIHYAITNGGSKPNVVPDLAESHYYARAPKNHQLFDIVKRIIKVAQGAGMMTETELEYQINSGMYDFLANLQLSTLLEENCKNVSVPKPEEEELELFKAIGSTISETGKNERFSKYRMQDFDYNEHPAMPFFDCTDWKNEVIAGSTDVGDVSWTVPTGQLMGAAWAFGVPAHTWQATACSGTKYATKVALMIGKVLAGAAYDAISTPEHLQNIKVEFSKNTSGFIYKRIGNKMEVMTGE